MGSSYIQEFIGLRAKCYSIKSYIINSKGDKIMNETPKSKNKGIITTSAHESYKLALFEEESFQTKQNPR